MKYNSDEQMFLEQEPLLLSLEYNDSNSAENLALHVHRSLTYMKYLHHMYGLGQFCQEFPISHKNNMAV